MIFVHVSFTYHHKIWCILGYMNRVFFESLESDIRKYSNIGKISLIGDFNFRCGQRSDVVDMTEEYAKYIPTVDINSNADEQLILSERFSMDMICNASEVNLLDLCKSTDLKIVNGRIGDCIPARK